MTRTLQDKLTYDSEKTCMTCEHREEEKENAGNIMVNFNKKGIWYQCYKRTQYADEDSFLRMVIVYTDGKSFCSSWEKKRR